MILREMLVDDLDQVMEIEEELFSVPWTKEGKHDPSGRRKGDHHDPSGSPRGK